MLTAPTTQGTWILIGVMSFVLAGGSLLMAVQALRKPHLPMDDSQDEERTRTDVFALRTTTTRAKIFDGMAKTGPVRKPAPPPPEETAEQEDRSMRTNSFQKIWKDIADPMEPTGTGKVLADVSEPDPPEMDMLKRPESCEYCGKTPPPDYQPHKVDGGTIFCCPSCNCTVYVIPDGIAHHYLGRIYCVKDDKEFVPQQDPSFTRLKHAPAPKNMDLDEDGCVLGLFSDLVDQS